MRKINKNSPFKSCSSNPTLRKIRLDILLVPGRWRASYLAKRYALKSKESLGLTKIILRFLSPSYSIGQSHHRHRDYYTLSSLASSRLTNALMPCFKAKILAACRGTSRRCFRKLILMQLARLMLIACP